MTFQDEYSIREQATRLRASRERLRLDVLVMSLVFLAILLAGVRTVIDLPLLWPGAMPASNNRATATAASPGGKESGGDVSPCVVPSVGSAPIWARFYVRAYLRRPFGESDAFHVLPARPGSRTWWREEREACR